MQRQPIGVGIHRDRFHTQLATRSHDANGNLAAIGDENFFEHESIEIWQAQEPRL
jgi:hypothetical protein